MKPRAAAALLLLLLPFAGTVQASPDSDAAATPSVMDKTLEFLHLKHNPNAAKKASHAHHQIEVRLAIAPLPIKLSRDREVKVTVSLFNWSKKFLDLEFPTSQRIEILIRDPSGKVVTTWSEDQSFTNDPASITVNPGERLEYDELLATREMVAGNPYTIEASFPNYPELKTQQTVIPQK